MTRSDFVLAFLLFCSAAAITVGAALILAPAGLIVGGILFGALSFLLMADVGADE